MLQVTSKGLYGIIRWKAEGRPWFEVREEGRELSSSHLDMNSLFWVLVKEKAGGDRRSKGKERGFIEVLVSWSNAFCGATLVMRCRASTEDSVTQRFQPAWMIQGDFFTKRAKNVLWIMHGQGVFLLGEEVREEYWYHGAGNILIRQHHMVVPHRCLHRCSLGLGIHSGVSLPWNPAQTCKGIPLLPLFPALLHRSFACLSYVPFSLSVGEDQNSVHVWMALCLRLFREGWSLPSSAVCLHLYISMDSQRGVWPF